MGNEPKDERRTIKPALAALSATHLVLSGFGGLYHRHQHLKKKKKEQKDIQHIQEPAKNASTLLPHASK